MSLSPLGMIGKITRSMVARRLALSIGAVRRMERTGELHPTKVDGVHYFDAGEVASVAAKRSKKRTSEEGVMQARVFLLFEEGQSLGSIVIATMLPVSKVRELYAEFKAGLEGDPKIVRQPPSGLKLARIDENRARADLEAWEKSIRGAQGKTTRR